MTTDAQRRNDSEGRNARIRAAQAKFGIGKKPASIPEIDRAPKPSKKGSCVRRRAGQLRSIKAVKDLAKRDLESTRKAAKALDRQLKAESHAAYVKEQEAAALKEQEAAALEELEAAALKGLVDYVARVIADDAVADGQAEAFQDQIATEVIDEVLAPEVKS